MIVLSINRDIDIYVSSVKITPYFLVKHPNNCLNGLKSRYIFLVLQKIRITEFQQEYSPSA